MAGTRQSIAPHTSYQDIWKGFMTCAPDRRAWWVGLAQIKMRQEGIDFTEPPYHDDSYAARQARVDDA